MVFTQHALGSRVVPAELSPVHEGAAGGSIGIAAGGSTGTTAGGSTDTTAGGSAGIAVGSSDRASGCTDPPCPSITMPLSRRSTCSVRLTCVHATPCSCSHLRQKRTSWLSQYFLTFSHAVDSRSEVWSGINACLHFNLHAAFRSSLDPACTSGQECMAGCSATNSQSTPRSLSCIPTPRRCETHGLTRL